DAVPAKTASPTSAHSAAAGSANQAPSGEAPSGRASSRPPASDRWLPVPAPSTKTSTLRGGKRGSAGRPGTVRGGASGASAARLSPGATVGRMGGRMVVGAGTVKVSDGATDDCSARTSSELVRAVASWPEVVAPAVTVVVESVVAWAFGRVGLVVEPEE